MSPRLSANQPWLDPSGQESARGEARFRVPALLDEDPAIVLGLDPPRPERPPGPAQGTAGQTGTHPATPPRTAAQHPAQTPASKPTTPHGGHPRGGKGAAARWAGAKAGGPARPPGGP